MFISKDRCPAVRDKKWRPFKGSLPRTARPHGAANIKHGGRVVSCQVWRCEGKFYGVPL